MDSTFVIEQPGSSLFYHYMYIQAMFRMLKTAGLEASSFAITTKLKTTQNHVLSYPSTDYFPPWVLVGTQSNSVDASVWRGLPEADLFGEQQSGGWGVGNRETGKVAFPHQSCNHCEIRRQKRHFEVQRKQAAKVNTVSWGNWYLNRNLKPDPLFYSNTWAHFLYQEFIQGL